MLGAVVYLYVSYGRIIDARLHGERDRAVPRVFARPLTLQAGQNMSQTELVARLNDVGYAQRARVERAGEFAIDRHHVVLLSRGGDQAGKVVTVSFPEPPVARKKTAKPPPPPPQRITKIQAGQASLERVTLDAPLLTAMMTGSREKRRRVALETIPARMQEAVLAIEDRRFYYHPGVDPIRMVGALFTNVFGDRPYLVGGSTITQQLARNFFLTEQMAVEQQTRQRSYGRKILEQFMAMILETKATKDEILELYLNDVYLGHRGSFALHGVAEASKIYFGKDVRNLTLSEAALIAGIIQSPYNHSPFTNPERARDRRNVVLRAMVDAGYITSDAAERAQKEPIAVVARAVDNEAPYFVDYIGDVLDATFPGVVSKPGALDIYTTLDLNLQRYAQDAVRDGIASVDTMLARRKRGPAARRAGGAGRDRSALGRDPRVHRRPLLQPVAVQSRRQRAPPDRIDVQAVRLSRGVREGGRRGHGDITPATLVFDEPTTWSLRQPGVVAAATTTASTTAPSRCGARWPCRATSPRSKSPSKPATTASSRCGRRPRSASTDQVKPYPSVALGIVELTPLEVARGLHGVHRTSGTLEEAALAHQRHQRRGRGASPKVEAGTSRWRGRRRRFS